MSNKDTTTTLPKKLPHFSFPTKDNEHWRFTPLNELSNLQFHNLGESTPLDINKFMNFKSIHFSNGELKNSDFKLTVDDTKKSFQNYFQELNSSEPTRVIHVGKNVNEKIDLIFEQNKKQLKSNFNIKIILEENSELTLIERYFNSSSSFICHNLEFEINKNAKVKHIRIIEDNQGFIYIYNHAQLNRDSFYTNTLLNTHSQWTRIDSNIDINDCNSHCELNGAYILSSNDELSAYSMINHNSEHTTSAQVYKGLLDDESHLAFNGRINIAPKAQKINSEQLNKNLILSKKAKVNTLPQLQIGADDVKCSHGATIGKLNDEEIFYLQSRGISKKRSIELLTRGFVSDILHFEEEQIDKYCKDILSKNLQNLSHLRGE